MKVCYKKLWKLLIDKDMTKKELVEKACISMSTITKMSKGMNVTTTVLAKICNVLNCNIADVVEFV